MELMEELGLTGIVPVAVIEDAEHAVPAAQAMADGGINAMEITMRTAAALDSMEKVALNCKNVIVGAGTVLTLDDEKRCLDRGARFIVSPGFNAEMADYSVRSHIPYLPGCVTPTEIMEAMTYGLSVLKFFPANIYGGLKGMKALSGPFPGIKFLPTGGINADNLSEYLAADFIHAVGGSWVCAKADISEGNYEKIRALSEEAVRTAMGFSVAHIGINSENAAAAAEAAKTFEKAFGFDCREGNSSIFASSGIEIMKSPYLGSKGHLAIYTNQVERAVAYLEKKGFTADESTFKRKNGRLSAAYLTGETGGFAVHLVRR